MKDSKGKRLIASKDMEKIMDDFDKDGNRELDFDGKMTLMILLHHILLCFKNDHFDFTTEFVSMLRDVA